MHEFLTSIYFWLKAGHLIMVIAWMAGIMYLPRLFIYHHQSTAGGEAERFFGVMERRLLKGIMNPSMMLVWGLAILMLIANPGLFSSIWFKLKFVAAGAITGVHIFYASAFKKFAAGQKPYTEKFWRIINEVPFVLMIVIVIMVIVKPF